MKKILLIIGIITMLISVTSMAIAEQVDLSVDIEASYLLTAMVYDSEEMGEIIDGIDFEMTEGLTEATFEMESGNILIVSASPMLVLNGFNEIVVITITTEKNRLAFIASGQITAGFTLNE